MRYVLTATVNVEGEKVLVDAELTDQGRGVAVWTGSAAADREDVSSTNLLAGNLAVQLREAIYASEAKRLLESGAKPRTPMEHKMLGDEQRQQFVTLESERRARVHYERAMALDPSFAPAIIAVAYIVLAELDLDPSAPRHQLLEQADMLSKQAVSREQGSAPAWQLRAEVLARQWMWDAAIDASDLSLQLDSGRSFAFAQRASILINMGKPREAIAFADRALVLAEQRSGYGLFQRCRALMALAELAASVEACEKSLAREEWWLQRAYLLAAYALLGREDKVAIERDRLLSRQPNFTLERIRALRLSNTPEFEAQVEASLFRGLRLAGIGDGR